MCIKIRSSDTSLFKTIDDFYDVLWFDAVDDNVYSLQSYIKKDFRQFVSEYGKLYNIDVKIEIDENHDRVNRYWMYIFETEDDFIKMMVICQ